MKQQFIIALLAICPLASVAQNKVGSAVTGHPDIFGNTTTTHKDRYGNNQGTAVTGKPDVFGNTTTTYKDRYGNKTGTSVTGKPDVFGNTTTTYKDRYGNSTGTSVTGKPDVFGNTTTTYKDRYGTRRDRPRLVIRIYSATPPLRSVIIETKEPAIITCKYF